MQTLNSGLEAVILDRWPEQWSTEGYPRHVFHAVLPNLTVYDAEQCRTMTIESHCQAAGTLPVLVVS